MNIYYMYYEAKNNVFYTMKGLKQRVLTTIGVFLQDVIFKITIKRKKKSEI